MILHRHKWNTVGCFCDGTWHYVHGSMVLVTHVALRCNVCGKLKSKDLVGKFTMAELSGESAQVSDALRYLEK
jgi:hypothetical protein